MSISYFPRLWQPQTKIVTSGSRPSSPIVGQQIYETDTKVTSIWDGTNWSPMGGLKRYVKSVATGVGSTSSTAFVDVPGPVDLSFTKVAPHTALHVWGTMSHYVAGTGLSAHAVQINGVDYSIGDFFFNTPNEHATVGMNANIALGLAAGSYTARLRWRIVSGLTTINVDTNDTAVFALQEVLL